MHTTITDRILLTLQNCLPARFMGACMYRLSRAETSWLKNLLIRGFSSIYSVHTTEAELQVPDGYRSFNAFFTRSLRPGARLIDADPMQFVAPADGTIAQLGRASKGQLIQAKGINFSAADLLGDANLAIELADCPYTTIYLAPYNYHRLHMPVAGKLEQTLFIPGLLYSVNARSTALVPGLYARNERLVCQFNSKAGRFAMVLVGAMNVASISTAWSGEILSTADRRIQRATYPHDSGPQLARGEYMGHFNMGSTVVILGPQSMAEWSANLRIGKTIRVGEAMARMAKAGE
jgi:phosphatidylserine decarboxylase